MITEFMRLTTARDADTWAAQMGLQSEEQERRMSGWLWEHKPSIGCTYVEHPVNDLSTEDFWAIAEGE